MLTFRSPPLHSASRCFSRLWKQIDCRASIFVIHLSLIVIETCFTCPLQKRFRLLCRLLDFADLPHRSRTCLESSLSAYFLALEGILRIRPWRSWWNSMCCFRYFLRWCRKSFRVRFVERLIETDTSFSFLPFFLQSCPTVENGYNVCDPNSGACSAGCNSGFVLYASGNTQACFATQSDVNNCGNPGNVCPSSYNGIGSSTCRSGTCKIACPSGYFLRKANSDSNP